MISTTSFPLQQTIAETLSLPCIAQHQTKLFMNIQQQSDASNLSIKYRQAVTKIRHLSESGSTSGEAQPYLVTMYKH